MNRFFVGARYIIIPFATALLLCVIALLIQIIKYTYHLVSEILVLSSKEVLIEVLNIVDIALLANLVLLIAFSAYDSFVSDLSENSQDVRGLEILQDLTLTNVKFKLLGSMIIISGIGLISSFLSLDPNADTLSMGVLMQIGIHLTFALTALLLAFADQINH